MWRQMADSVCMYVCVYVCGQAKQQQMDQVLRSPLPMLETRKKFLTLDCSLVQPWFGHLVSDPGDISYGFLCNFLK